MSYLISTATLFSETADLTYLELLNNLNELGFSVNLEEVEVKTQPPPRRRLTKPKAKYNAFLASQ